MKINENVEELQQQLKELMRKRTEQTKPIVDVCITGNLGNMTSYKTLPFIKENINKRIVELSKEFYQVVGKIKIIELKLISMGVI